MSLLTSLLRENFRNTDLEGLLRSLKALKIDPPSNAKGICGNTLMDGRSTKIKDTLFKSWPKYSGSLGFPINDPSGLLDPHQAYIYYLGDLWDKGHQYGKLRWELVEFMIESLETALKDWRDY